MKKNRLIQWLSTHVFLCVVFLLLLDVLPYIVVFSQNGISQDIEDWAHLGGYISGTLGVISIFLLYLTYREQRMTNHVEHFEKILYKHLDEINRLQEKHHEKIEYLCNKLLGLFIYVGGYHYNNEFTQKQVEGVIQYAYSHFINIELNDRASEDVFRYVEYTLKLVEEDALIDSKEFYSLEIKNKLVTETKVVSFFYFISEKNLEALKLFDKYKFFKDLNVDNEMFKFVVSMFCVVSDSITETDESQWIPDLYEIKDNITFDDIVNHLQEIESLRHNKMQDGREKL